MGAADDIKSRIARSMIVGRLRARHVFLTQQEALGRLACADPGCPARRHIHIQDPATGRRSTIWLDAVAIQQEP